jgi:hypothetical protein
MLKAAASPLPWRTTSHRHLYRSSPPEEENTTCVVSAAVRAPAGQFSALVSSLSARNSIDPLLPSCITYHRLLTNDPLIRLTNVPDTFNEVHRASIGMEPAPLPELWQVENALHYFEGLAPLIRDGIITVLPIDAIHATPAYRPIPFPSGSIAAMAGR